MFYQYFTEIIKIFYLHFTYITYYQRKLNWVDFCNLLICYQELSPVPAVFLCQVEDESADLAEYPQIHYL